MLAVDGDPKALVRHLGLNFRSWESVLLVGHDPYLSQFISTLLTGTRDDLPMEFEKGGLAKLIGRFPHLWSMCARLEWLLTPKILKKLI